MSHAVRRVYLEARALVPGIVVRASVIPWSAPPSSEDFADAAPMQRVFQDWHAWRKDGILDLAVPMNDARETDERVRRWLDGWIALERRHQHERRIAVGLGAYLNAPEATLAQATRARKADGTGRLAFLSAGTPDAEGVFPRPAPVPSFARVAHPAAGAIAGTAATATPAR